MAYGALLLLFAIPVIIVHYRIYLEEMSFSYEVIDLTGDEEQVDSTEAIERPITEAISTFRPYHVDGGNSTTDRPITNENSTSRSHPADGSSNFEHPNYKEASTSRPPPIGGSCRNVESPIIEEALNFRPYPIACIKRNVERPVIAEASSTQPHPMDYSSSDVNRLMIEEASTSQPHPTGAGSSNIEQVNRLIREANETGNILFIVWGPWITHQNPDGTYPPLLYVYRKNGQYIEYCGTPRKVTRIVSREEARRHISSNYWIPLNDHHGIL